MKHHVREEKGVVVVGFEGDVDLKSSPEARKVLLDCVGRKVPVLVDLSGVHYIDSSGVASLVEAYQMARKGGHAFVLAAVSDGVMRVLQLARMDKVFTICTSVADGFGRIGK
jgi:anti-sigma B factor antagonist